MKIGTAKLLRNAAKALNVNASINRNYSGRGMYGRTTIAISLDDSGDMMKLIAKAANKLGGNELDEFLNDLEFATDNMGKGIVYY